MNAEEIMHKFKEKDYKITLQETQAGVKNKVMRRSLWVTIERERLNDVVQYLIEIVEDFPHFSVISAADFEDDIELNYHFTVGYGKRFEEVAITFKLHAPKKNLIVASITDLVPAAVYSEREIHEMMGVEFDGLKDTRHLFLTADFPKGVYPWRRDKTGPKKTNKLYEVWKP